MSILLNEKNKDDIWAELKNIAIDEDENIDEPFLHFSEGTHREEIWHWFEEYFDVSIAEMMGL